MTVILAFIVIGFVLYSRCLRGAMLLDDSFIFAMKQTWIQGDWRTALMAPWRRLLLLSYSINGKFAGHDTYPFHVTNVCIHILNSLLSILLFRALGFLETWSLIGGAIYLVHPQNVAAAGYISGRSSLLSGFFVILSILAVLHGYPILAFPVMAGALYSKEDTAACFLLLACLAGGWWALAFLGAPILGYYVQRKQIYGISQTVNRMEQPEYSFTAVSEYFIRLPLWLVGSALNNKPHIQPATKWTVWVAMFNIAAIAFSISIGSQLWWTCLALTFLSPMLLYLFVPIEDPIMDYRNYVGMIGGTGLVLCLISLFGTWFGFAWITYLFLRAWSRVGRFRNPITFWVGCMKDGSDESPYVRAQLAAAFYMVRDFKSAEHWNKKALELAPNNRMALIGLASIYGLQSRLIECREALETCIRFDPKHRKAWEHLRQLYTHLKDDANVTRCDLALATL